MVTVFFDMNQYSFEATLEKMPEPGDVLHLYASQTYGQGPFQGTIKVTVGKKLADKGFDGRKKLPTFSCSIEF